MACQAFQNNRQVPRRDSCRTERPKPSLTLHEMGDQRIDDQLKQHPHSYVLSRYGRHIDLKSGRNYPSEKRLWKKLQHCCNRAMDWVQIAMPTSQGEHSPLKGIQVSHGGSLRINTGVGNLSHSGAIPTTSINLAEDTKSCPELASTDRV